MAILKLGATIVGIRGTIGGLVFSANQAGPYARIWQMPSNPRTELQTQSRSFLSQQASGWRALTSSQRADWDTFAALPAQALTNPLGETYYISGFGWYVKTNARLLQMDRTPNTTYPTSTRPSAPTVTIWHYDNDAPGFRLRVRFSGLSDTANDLVCFARPIVAGARAVNTSGWFLVRARQGPVSDPQEIVCTTRHILKWGNALDGWQLFISGHEQTPDGLRSSPGVDNGVFPI